MIPTTNPAYRPRGQRTLHVTLTINGFAYRLQFLPAGGLRLIKSDGQTYEVTATPTGSVCTCAGHRSRGWCKHTDGLLTLRRLLARAASEHILDLSR
jgi:hypothetical protein